LTKAHQSSYFGSQLMKVPQNFSVNEKHQTKTLNYPVSIRCLNQVGFIRIMVLDLVNY